MRSPSPSGCSGGGPSTARESLDLVEFDALSASVDPDAAGPEGRNDGSITDADAGVRVEVNDDHLGWRHGHRSGQSGALRVAAVMGDDRQTALEAEAQGQRTATRIHHRLDDGRRCSPTGHHGGTVAVREHERIKRS